jgi:hypothetical protein
VHLSGDKGETGAMIKRDTNTNTLTECIMPRLKTIVFPSMSKKSAEKWVNQFSAFKEKQ